MYTTITVRSVPVRFVALELDEHEAAALIDALALHRSNELLDRLSVQLNQALALPAAEPAQDVTPLPATKRATKRWTCPECGHETGLYDRRAHYKTYHPDLEPPAVLRNTHTAKPTSAPPIDPPADSYPAETIVNARLVNPDPTPPLVMAMRADLVSCRCGRKYATAGALQSHIARDHDGVEPDGPATIIEQEPSRPLPPMLGRFDHDAMPRRLVGTRL